MTHLYIEQATDRTEEVNSSIISKLYELAISGDLDETSDLKGRLHSTSAKEKHVTYLNDNFDDLYISADALYLSFEDPDVETYMKRYIGNDEGVTLLDVLAFVASSTAFGANYRNTHTNRYGGFTESSVERASINSFDELSLFNGLTTIYGDSVLASSSISSITLPYSVVRLNTWAFARCANLSSINLNNIQYIGGESLAYTKLSGVIDLPNVIQIGDSTRGSSFIDCTSITEINTGSNFTTFVNGSNFENCTSLTKVTGLSNLTSIPGRTFYNCNALSSVDIDWNKITSMGSLAFMRCHSLLFGELDLSTVTTIPQEAFSECDGITKLLLGNNTTISGSSTFYRCTGITEANLGSGITFENNGHTMFAGCSKLTTVTGLSNITTIPRAMFSECTMLSSVDIDWTKITTIGDSAFNKCQALLLTTADFTNVESIGDFAFRNTSLNIVDLSSATTIEYGAFDNATVLYMHIPGTVKTLPNYLCNFLSCHYKIDEGVTTFGNASIRANRLILPSTITQIDGYSYSPPSTEFLVIKATTPPTYSSTCFSSNWNYPIYVPDNSVAAYKAQPGGAAGGVVWEDRIKSFTDFEADFPGISLNGTGYATDPIQ